MKFVIKDLKSNDCALLTFGFLEYKESIMKLRRLSKRALDLSQKLPGFYHEDDKVPNILLTHSSFEKQLLILKHEWPFPLRATLTIDHLENSWFSSSQMIGLETYENLLR